MKEYFLMIEADYNDADYITDTSRISEEELLLVKKIVAQLEQTSGHWPTGDQGSIKELYAVYQNLLSEEEVDWFCELVPYYEYGISRINSVRYCEVQQLHELYKWRVTR